MRESFADEHPPTSTYKAYSTARSNLRGSGELDDPIPHREFRPALLHRLREMLQVGRRRRRRAGEEQDDRDVAVELPKLAQLRDRPLRRDFDAARSGDALRDGVRRPRDPREHRVTRPGDAGGDRDERE